MAEVPQWLIDQLVANPIPENVVPIRPYSHGSHIAPLNGLVRTVSGAHEGERNALLFWGACRIGEMAAQGKIGRQHFSEACNALIAAAMQTGLTRMEAERTVVSAMRNGR